MIRVEQAPEPPDFHKRVRVVGNAWLEKGTTANLPSYWRRAARSLREAFGG